MGHSASGDTFDLEFRCTEDDAWYSVKSTLHGDKLTVIFENFPEISFKASDFNTVEEVDEFSKRIRSVSSQLQDNECYKIIEGTRVCACSRTKEDLRYFDATVEAVEYKDHLFEKTEEECMCTFVLSWLHGPNAGDLVPSSVANICIVNIDAPLNSTITSFLKLAKENVKRALLRCNSFSKSCVTGQNIPAAKRKSISQDEIQETKLARQFPGSVGGNNVKLARNQVGEDRDIGGVPFNMNKIEESGNHHYVIIDNLDKDLSPTSIMEFIHRQTSVSAEVYVFPSLLAESYTRGAIVLDSKTRLEEIYKFVTNPDHIIISSTGRPWVITEEKIRRGNFKTTIGSLMPISQNGIVENKIKVVRLGTEEYRRAARLKDLFMDFIDHQRRLHERLTMEHNRNSCPRAF